MKDLYPANWEEIRDHIELRADGCCEGCGLENGSRGYRDQLGTFHKVTDDALLISYRHLLLTIVCTVGHRDHDPTNNDESNLSYWCQQCHNGYDAKSRLAGLRKRLRIIQEKTQVTLQL